MRPCRPVAYTLLIAAATLLTAGCATNAPPDPAVRAERNDRGQSALEGMENAVLKDNNPDTPVRAKPAN